MKILFWTDGFWPSIGGMETQALQFVLGMKGRGHDCLVIAQSNHGAMLSEETYKEIPIRRFDFNSIIANRELKHIRAIRESLGRIAEEFRPDVLYLNTLANGSALGFLLFRSLFPIPVVATIHSPYYWDGVPPIVLQICNQIDHLCCASKWGLSFMEKALPQHIGKMKMIYYGIALPKTKPQPLPFSPPTLLFLGRLSSEKGFDLGLEAFSLLKQSGSNARLIIAGEGQERPYLEHLAAKMGLSDSVEFTGALLRNGEAVYSVINRATFTIMPSQFEGFGLAALESMQMNRPVVASDIGGLPEIVSHKERGFLVASPDPQSYCTAMQELLNCPEKTIEMGLQAGAWAQTAFSLEENLKQYEQLFEASCLQSV